jgi:hypothetical protein
MIQIAPLAKPRKRAVPPKPVVLKASVGRTPMSRYLRAQAVKAAKGAHA